MAREKFTRVCSICSASFLAVKPHARYCSIRCIRDGVHGTAIETFWAKVRKDVGCWPWTAGKHPKGYGYFTAYGKTIPAHRFSWELHNGPIPEGMWVLHRCDNPPCVNPEHLFLGTNADNVADKVSKGRQSHMIGEGHPCVKLTNEEALDIMSTSDSLKQAAKRHGVSPSMVSKIRRKRAWLHLRT